MAISTVNRHLVVSMNTRGDGRPIHVFYPPSTPMTKDEALSFAAWLVVLADGPALEPDERTPMTGPGFDKLTRFDQVLEAVKNG